MGSAKASGTRCIAIVGPYESGKTTLLESLLSISGTSSRKGSVDGGNSVGDGSQEARARQMGVEMNVASVDYMGDKFTFLDCPGSVEFMQDTFNALAGVDAAVVVVEPDAGKVRSVHPILQHLDREGIPRFIFVNKIDKSERQIDEFLDELQQSSEKPLILRQLPIWENEIVTGFVDLALDRAYVYREHAISEVIQLPSEIEDDKALARYEMLEKLADFDDKLMEELLDDIEPPMDEIFDDLAEDLRQGSIVPVLLGSAQNDNGIRRLLKALRHEVPEVAQLSERLGMKVDGAPLAVVVKTSFGGQGGKSSIARVLSGTITDSTGLNGSGHVSMASIHGQDISKITEAVAGDVVAFGRLEAARTGDFLGVGELAKKATRSHTLTPVFARVISAVDRKDEVKLSEAVARLLQEDPSLKVEQNSDTHEMLLWGQGDIHLAVAIDRLKNRNGLELTTDTPHVPYKEAITKSLRQRGKHRKQSGGHGQYGDVVLEIKPLPRGSGFVFEEKISGGVVPRQYFTSVERGVKEYLAEGPLGFPVVDVAVTLVDGSHHAVDSSDAAFHAAGRLAMSEAMPQCKPILLEPIAQVAIHVPLADASKMNPLISGRRGHILGIQAREGWSSWETYVAELPQSEIYDLIVDLRSLTNGTGTFEWAYDHLDTLSGKLREDVLARQAAGSA